jgi:hypothetical protein
MTSASERGEVNPSALVIGVTALVGVLGSFTVSGTVGRVLRNHPETFRIALVFVLVGALVLAIAALPISAGMVDAVCSIAGVVLIFVGLVVGAVAGATSVRDKERPVVSAQLVDDGLHLTGKVAIEDRSSDSRLVLLIEGLKVADRGRGWDVTTLQQSYLGPSGEGNVEVPIDVRVPPGRFDAVGIRSWTETESDPEDNPPCRTPPRRVSALTNRTQTQAVHKAGTGCLILSLPPIPVGPQLGLSWSGTSTSSDRLQLSVNADNVPARLSSLEGIDGQAVRVAVQVKGQLRNGTRMVLYRAVLRPDVHGNVKVTAQVPVVHTFRRICAVALFARRAGFPDETCPSARGRARGRVHIEVRPPNAVPDSAKPKSGT